MMHQSLPVAQPGSRIVTPEELRRLLADEPRVIDGQLVERPRQAAWPVVVVVVAQLLAVVAVLFWMAMR